MGIVLASNFDVNAQLPLDSRSVVFDNTARDAIATGKRFQGLMVFVVSTGLTYQLVGGITNSNWVQVPNSFTLSSNLIRSSQSGITAFATGGQASAFQITKDISRITTVATANDSVKLPVAVAGLEIVVINDGANSLDIFPATGESIDALTTNAAYSLTTTQKNVRMVSPASGIWRSASGGGGSGGSFVYPTVQAIAAGAEMSASTLYSNQVIRIVGNGGPQVASVTPFGPTGGWIDGTLVELIGTDDTSTLSIDFNDAAKGCVGNFKTITLAKYQVARFRFNTAMDRWIYV